VAVGVLAAWGTGLAVLAGRESSRTAVDTLAESAMRIAPIANYFAVRDGRAQVGFSSFTTDTITDGLQFAEYVVRGVADNRAVEQLTVRASRRLVLRHIMLVNAAGRTEVTVGDSTIVVARGGSEQRVSFRAPLLVPALVPLAVALGPSTPRIGDTHAFDVFDPATLGVRRMTVAVRAESSWVVVDSASWDAGARRWRGAHADTVHAWNIQDEAAPSWTAWVDEQGQLVAGTLPGGHTLVRTAYELAFENWRQAVREPEAHATASSDREPAGVPVLDSAWIVVRGLTLSALDASSGWQQVRGDTLIVAASSPGPVVDYWLPPDRRFRAEHVRDLQRQPWIEADAPAIAAHAQRLRARDSDPVRVTQRLARWIVDSVRLEPSLAPPSALATLRSRSGDANHRLHLLVALARAAGIPARPVSGLVLTGNTPAVQSWAEVWLKGAWVAVDPVAGDLAGTAALVRLITGPVAATDELTRLVSRARITVIRSVSRSSPS
jgi:transglutaminase-like putative cysteine protease